MKTIFAKFMQWLSEQGHGETKKVRSWMKLVLLVFAAWPLFGMSMMAYDWLSHWNAEQHVMAYCHTVSVGAPIAGLADAARSQGLNVVLHPGVKDESGLLIQPYTILVSEGSLFTVYRCIIQHDGTAVTKVRMSSHYH